jgi:hypothetical protein
VALEEEGWWGGGVRGEGLGDGEADDAAAYYEVGEVGGAGCGEGVVLVVVIRRKGPAVGGC